MLVTCGTARCSKLFGLRYACARLSRSEKGIEKQNYFHQQRSSSPRLFRCLFCKRANQSRAPSHQLSAPPSHAQSSSTIPPSRAQVYEILQGTVSAAFHTLYHSQNSSRVPCSLQKGSVLPTTDGINQTLAHHLAYLASSPHVCRKGRKLQEQDVNKVSSAFPASVLLHVKLLCCIHTLVLG
jgi:hypothetical protein